MLYDAAQKAKEHFAHEKLKVKDKELTVSDAILESFLFVGNLNDDVEPEHLHSLFRDHGQTERAIVTFRWSFFFLFFFVFVMRQSLIVLLEQVMRSSMTGRKKGYGFVEMRMKAQAGAAKAILGGFNFHGRSLRIDWCRLSKLEELHSPVLFVDKLPPGHLVWELALLRSFLWLPSLFIYFLKYIYFFNNIQYPYIFVEMFSS